MFGTEGIVWKDQKYDIITKIVVDLKGLWSITDLDCDYLNHLEKEFCPHCTATCGTAYAFTVDDITICRRTNLNKALLGCDPKNTIFCGLHAKMRVTEKLLLLMANQLDSATQTKGRFFDPKKYRPNASMEELNEVLKANNITHFKIKKKKGLQAHGHI